MDSRSSEGKKGRSSSRADDSSIDEHLVLFWGDDKKIVTGADILGRLLKGVLAPTELL